ncbi:MAG: BREX-1 system phosphatase PglZ type A, partial [Casimicrobiaceae bacterium]
LAVGRFPLKGSGKRFVHGGLSLQEIVLPVLQIQKTRVDDTERVEIDLLRAPTKITTGRVSLTFYQDRPVATKVLSRSLRIGIFTPEGMPISELKTVTFDSAEPEARERESTIDMALSRAADPHNGREVEIRMEELTGGSQTAVPYKIHRLKLQKPFATDFDEL